MKSKILNNVLLTGTALAFTGLSRVFYNIAIGKNYDAGILGQVNIVISVAMLLALVASLEYESAATKFLSEFPSINDRKGIYTLLLKRSIITSAMIIFAAYVFKDYIIQQLELEKSLYLIALPLIFFTALHHFFRGCFYGMDFINKYFAFEIESTFLFFFVLIASVNLGKQTLLYPFLLYYGLFSLLSVICLKEYFQLDLSSFSMGKELRIYGIIVLIGTLASTSKAYIANILTGVYLSPEQVGYYSAAVSITTILLFTPTIIGRVLLPSMSSSYGEGNIYTVRNLLYTATLWLSIISLFLGGIFIILSKDILVVLFKPAYAAATFSLQMLILGICLSTMVAPSVSALSGTAFVKVPNAAGVVGLIVSLAIWPFLIPRFGINGTAAGYIAGSILNSIIILYYVKKFYSLNLRKTFNVAALCLLIFTAAIIMGTIAPKYSSWISVAIYIILFIIIFKKDIHNIYSEIWSMYVKKSS